MVNQLSDYIKKSLHLVQIYASIKKLFVHGHYLFCEAKSFPRAYPEENCASFEEGYCVYYHSNLFHNARSFENWGTFNNYPAKLHRISSDT